MTEENVEQTDEQKTYECLLIEEYRRCDDKYFTISGRVDKYMIFTSVGALLISLIVDRGPGYIKNDGLLETGIVLVVLTILSMLATLVQIERSLSNLREYNLMRYTEPDDQAKMVSLRNKINKLIGKIGPMRKTTSTMYLLSMITLTVFCCINLT